MWKAIHLLTILSIGIESFEQTLTVRGKVVDERLQPLNQVFIYSADTLILGTTDPIGNFQLEIPPGTKSLIIAYTNMEWRKIEISGVCNNLEIILLSAGTYDSTSARKVNRLRKRQYRKLPKLHRSAFRKGVFQKDHPCYLDSL